MVVYSFNRNKPLQVDAELSAIRELVQKTKCKIDPLQNPDQKKIERRLLLLNKDILIFHFAGHAGGAAIELSDGKSDNMTFTDMRVFAETIAQDAHAMRLVFLNGCSTQDQSDYLRDQGVPAVISTTLPLDDDYAFDFAKQFYEFFFDRDYNLTLQGAFDRALRSFNSSDNTRFFTDTGEIKNRELLHPAKRGVFQFPFNGPRKIYQLEGDPKVLNQTFNEWQAPIPSAPDVPTPAPPVPPDGAKEQIRKLVGSGRVRDALDLLLKTWPDNMEAIVLSGRLAQLERENRMGVISHSNYQVSYNQIVAATLHLISSVE